MKTYLISGMREEMMEFVWEYITGNSNIVVMHRVDFYDSCGLYVKVKDGSPETNFLTACNAYGVKIRWREPNKEAA